MLPKPGRFRVNAAGRSSRMGSRAIVRSGDNYMVRSRRGWQMTDLLPESPQSLWKEYSMANWSLFGDEVRRRSTVLPAESSR
jgi:hypothetical protein